MIDLALAVVLLVLEKRRGKLVHGATALNRLKVPNVVRGGVGYCFAERSESIVAGERHHVHARINVGGACSKVLLFDAELLC